MQTSKEDTKLNKEQENIDDDEEEDIAFFRQHHSRKLKRISCSSSPEPFEQQQQQQQRQQKKGRKKSISNPNKTDKAGRTKLFYATSQGHLSRVKELVENGANVNFRDNAGWTPLHEAALKGQYEVGKYLIECGADVNARGFGQDTPLHDASSNGRADCVQLLVNHGADVFALNESKQRPIDVCEDKECQSILRAKMKQLDRLLARDKDGKSLLHYACINNKIERARHMLEQGADVNAKDNHDWTPLHLACLHGHLDIVKLLIQQGAVVNMLGSEDMDTPLHQASKHGHKEIVLYLIKSSNADVNIKNKYDQNPYDVSVSFPLIRQILTARMDEVRLEKEACNALDEIASRTASRNEPERQLMTREQRKIQHVMRVFANLEGDGKRSSSDDRSCTKRKRRRKSVSVESEDTSVITSTGSSSGHRKKPSTGTSLDPFKKDTTGRTNLHKYALRGNNEMVQTLLDLGADPNEKDYAGWTPLHEAALRGQIDVIKLLIKHGADVNARGGEELDTPLHDATENNHCDVVELLLENGANPFAKNASNLEPLDIAIEKDFEDIIVALQAVSPVYRKRKSQRKPIVKTEEEDDDDDDDEKHSEVKHVNQRRYAIDNADESDEPAIKRPKKRRRLIQAADLEKSSQYSRPKEKVRVKIEEEEEGESDKWPCISNKKRYTDDAKRTDSRSPIPTPPPEPWLKQREDSQRYSLLYSIQLSRNDFYVIDLQMCLFLGIGTTKKFWNTHPELPKLSVTLEQKRKLWQSFKPLLTGEDLDTFLARELYFIDFDDAMNIIKSDQNCAAQNVVTVTLDINPAQHKRLPPKVLWKTKYGYS